MEANTIKTLAEYIAKLREKNAVLENPEQYVSVPIDTNGVGQDHAEKNNDNTAGSL